MDGVAASGGVVSTHDVAPTTEPRWWYACDHPERPLDKWVIWVWDCDACTLALIAAAATDPEHRADIYTPANQRERITTVAETLAAVRAWRGENGCTEL